MDVIPFKGYRYDSSVTGDPGLCIAPPYDVIDPDQQQALHRRHPYNIVRVTRGLAESNDNNTSNVYTRAADALADWLKRGVLRQDDQDSFYVYVQEFEVAGQCYRRSGFIGLGKLQEYGQSVRPHEQTLAGPKADRLNLLRATKSQIGQIFMLYSDPQRTIDTFLERARQGQLLLRHTDDDQVIHQLYRITNPADIETIIATMKSKDVFIADGHHRYETALNYYNQTRNPAAAYQMMAFVNTHNQGLVVQPTHRLIKNVKGFEPTALLGRLLEEFDVARLAYADMVVKQSQRRAMLDALTLELELGHHAFGMYFNDGAFYVVTLRNLASMDTVTGEHSSAWRQLDVAILHSLVLEKLLGIDEAALKEQTHIEYVKDYGDAALNAMDQVDTGHCQGLFFLNSTPVSAVEAVALAGEKMPQKSTYFYPKIFSGLVVNILQTNCQSKCNSCHCKP